MNLAQTETQPRALPQKTFRRETTMPRQATDRPALEVNQRITRPDTSGADELAKILGLANNVGQNILADRREASDKRDSGDAILDFAEGSKDDDRFKSSRAYYQAYQREGAKRLAVDISNEVTEEVNARLNDSENPATLEDINGLIEGVFQKHTHDENGKLLDFGTPEAKALLGNALMEVRSSLLPQAQEAIKGQMDERVLQTVVQNRVYEHYRGAPIGAPITVKPADPLAPLPEGQEDPANLASVQPKLSPVRVAALEPFTGFRGMTPTSRIGAAREGGSAHNGEDYAVPIGTAIKAPLAGKVIAAFSNARGGNQVRVKLSDGTIVGFAHLSKLDVKQGAEVKAGDLLGASGNTGHSTGAHVHVTVEQNGRKVSAANYFKNASGAAENYAATGDEPELEAPGAQAEASPVQPFNFEGALAAVPPSIKRGAAKAFILQAVVNEANIRGDATLLEGLETSTKADGSPSFTPKEIDAILSQRETIAEKSRIKGDRVQHDLWEKNHHTLINALLSDDPPSLDFVTHAALSGQIDPDFAFTLKRNFEAEAKSDARETRMELRQANAEAENAIDIEVTSMVAERNTGHLASASAVDDQRLLQSGKLGTGKKAAARFRSLRAASRAGQQQLEQNPAYATYAASIKQTWGTKPAGSGGLVAASRGASGAYDPVVYSTMISAYHQKVREGVSPGEAYLYAVSTYAPKGDPSAASARAARIRVLKARQTAGR